MRRYGRSFIVPREWPLVTNLALRFSLCCSWFSFLDLFSFTMEESTNSVETSFITMLKRFEGVQSDEAAMARVHNGISLCEGQLFEACQCALADPIIGEEPMVKKWIKALLYLTSRNCLTISTLNK